MPAAMPKTLTCPVCNQTFEFAAPPAVLYVDCPSCRLRVPLPLPPPPPEEIFDAEVVEPEPRSEEVFAGEVVEPPPPLALVPATAASPAGADAAFAGLDLLRPREFRISRRGSSRHVITFDVHDDERNELVGELAELSSVSRRVGQILGMHKGTFDTTLVLTDTAADRPAVVIELDPYKGIVMSKPCRVRLFDGNDRLIAEFAAGKPIFGGLGLSWNSDTTILNANGEEWADVRGNRYLQPDYTVDDLRRRRLAKVFGVAVTSGWFATGFAWTSRKGYITVEMKNQAADDPRAKAIVLATVLTFEMLIASIPPPRPTVSVGS
jgi:hypothetical protein